MKVLLYAARRWQKSVLGEFRFGKLAGVRKIEFKRCFRGLHFLHFMLRKKQDPIWKWFFRMESCSKNLKRF